MKRHAMHRLVRWKDSAARKPMIVRGARQVGKTWLMQEFGRTHFEQVAYVNFDNNQRMQRVFEGDFDIARLIAALQIESRVSISPHNTLIILDEIQEAPQALASLKYFDEQAPEYAIVSAGSLLGVAMHRGSSFPVGKVEFMDLHPMSFTEFLVATGNEDLHELMAEDAWELVAAIKSRYAELLRNYFFTGGMPEVVSSFAEWHDHSTVRDIQVRLLAAYDQDFSKHAPIALVPRLRMVWNSIPSQLAKENRKFLYGSLRKGARAKDFELAIQWLQDSGLVCRVPRISKPAMPLSAYAGSGFKMFMFDVGLLAAMSGLDQQSILDGNRIFEEFKGALAEQYVLQQLRADAGIEPCYWSSERGSAEVDFVFQRGRDVFPLEVKAAENLQAKSLRSYCAKYSPRIALRTSMSDYRQQEFLTNVPLYAIGLVNPLLR